MGLNGTHIPFDFKITDVIDLSGYAQNTAYQALSSGFLLLNIGNAGISNQGCKILLSEDEGSTYKTYQHYSTATANYNTSIFLITPITKGQYFKYIVQTGNLIHFELHKAGN